VRKIISVLAAIAVFLSAFYQPQSAQAASPIRIFIDGQLLQTREAPVAIGGYTMVPLRGIFEALQARVVWNQKAQTVTATKRDTTVVLTLGARTATINNQTVTLDAPARAIRGSTMVPVRFVSEALGDDVVWDKLSQSVLITTKAVVQVGAATSLAVSTVSQNGDGRDLKVAFTAPSDQSNVNGYRVLVVKANNSSSFNLAKAQAVGASNYTSVGKSGSSPSVTLTSQSRDVDGALLRANQAYRVYVLTVGKETYALSSPSVSISLTAGPQTVDAASNVKIEDINDYGDGRDVRVTFSKSANESNVSGYRVILVKTGGASSFNASAANGLSSSNYATVAKTGSGTLSVTLGASARDSSGALIKNGEAYTAFVLAVSSIPGSRPNALSAGSPSVALVNSGVGAATNVTASDISDYNNGRDLQVSFTKPSVETNIASYRLFVVKEAKAASFNLATASAITNSSNYTTIAKTNGNIVQALNAGSRDSDGALIQNGVQYRIFVLSVGNNGYNALSSASQQITLSNNNVTAATNVNAADVADYNNGLDMRVSFSKAANETNIAHYRVYVVKDFEANSFTLDFANAIPYYTVVYKTGNHITTTLNAESRDVYGELIQSGVDYKVFVLSVANSNNYQNALSAASPTIKLNNGGTVTAATNVTGVDVADNGNGMDLRVSFTKAAVETNITHYRIFVVPDAGAYAFNINTANTITDPSLFTFANTRSDYSQTLTNSAKDIYGQPIQNNVPYRVFVLSVGTSQGVNALSLASPAVTLTANSVPVATNVIASDVADLNNGSDLQVSYNKAADETNLNHYRVYVVKEQAVGWFSASYAQSLDATRYTAFPKSGAGSYSYRLGAGALDTDGAPITNNVGYRVYVLSYANNGSVSISTASNPITLSSGGAAVAEAVGLYAQQTNPGVVNVYFSFQPGTDGDVSHIAVCAKREVYGALTVDEANSANNSGGCIAVNKTTTPVPVTFSVDKNALAINETYRFYVLSVANPSSGKANKLSSTWASFRPTF